MFLSGRSIVFGIVSRSISMEWQQYASGRQGKLAVIVTLKFVATIATESEKRFAGRAVKLLPFHLLAPLHGLGGVKNTLG